MGEKVWRADYTLIQMANAAEDAANGLADVKIDYDMDGLIVSRGGYGFAIMKGFFLDLDSVSKHIMMMVGELVSREGCGGNV
jgi:hypothetical protein